MNTRAINKLNQEIKNIRYKSEDDEGAAEWHGHLEYILDQLVNNKITVEQAEESLGIKL